MAFQPLIEPVRKQMVRILKTLASADFQRTGRHSADGPVSLETLLTRITNHLPHHITFIDELGERRIRIECESDSIRAKENDSLIHRPARRQTEAVPIKP
jgi:hypothetical protein